MEDVFMIGKKLKQLRSFYNYSQEYVAAQLGVHKSVYCDYEKGMVKISPERLLKAAELYQMEIGIFYDREPLAIARHKATPTLGARSPQRLDESGLMERMFVHMEERSKRFEELYARTIELLERMNSRGGGGRLVIAQFSA